MPRFYRYDDLAEAGVPFTRQHIRRLENLGEHPMHVDLGSNSVGWLASEIDAWVERRIRARRVVPLPRRSAEAPVQRSRRGVDGKRAGGAVPTHGADG